MAKALLLALLCAPAVGVALTDAGDSTPRSLTTNPTVKDDLGGVKDEMRKMCEEMTSMQEKVGEMKAMQEKVDGLEKEMGHMGEMRMKVDGLEKEVVDLQVELTLANLEKAAHSERCDARIDELEGQLKQINEELEQMIEEKNTQSKQCDARFGSVERNLNETAARVDKGGNQRHHPPMVGSLGHATESRRRTRGATRGNGRSGP